MRACVQLLQSSTTLCDPMDCDLPGFSVHWILQARIMEWAAVPFSKRSSSARMKPVSLTSPALAGGFFTTGTTWEAHSDLYPKSIYQNLLSFI